MRIKDIRTGMAMLMMAAAAAGCSDNGEVEPAGTGGNGPYEVEVNFSIGVQPETDLYGRDATRSGYADYVFDPEASGYTGVYHPLFPEPPRELESSNNWQQVNDVRLYVFRKNEAGDFVYYKPSDKDGAKQAAFPVKAFADKFARSRTVVWWGGDRDVNEAHSYTVKAVLPEGEYHFLVVARDDDRVAAEDKLLTEPELQWQEGETLMANARIALTATARTMAATELFSGRTSAPVVVDGRGEFQKAIELKRAVAGLMVYVKNVPARLAAWQGFETDGVKQVGQGDTYVVNAIGVTRGGGFSDEVCLNDLKAPCQATVAQNAFLGQTYALKSGLEFFATEDKGENGIYYVDTNEEDNTLHKNSILLGAYLMPQSASDEWSGAEVGAPAEDDTDCSNLRKSLYLVFYHEVDGRLWPLQWWPVRVEAVSKEATASTNPYYFPFEANHFYRLGNREFSPDGSTLEKNDPLDLLNIKDLVIGVNGKWEGEYDYEIIN